MVLKQSTVTLLFVVQVAIKQRFLTVFEEYAISQKLLWGAELLEILLMFLNAEYSTEIGEFYLT